MADVQDSTFFNIIDDVLTNMSIQIEGVSSTGIMLTGDPGVGKTSLIKFMSKLLGMSLIVIEVPHIIEEQIINIPFIIFNTDGSQKKGSTQVKMADEPDSDNNPYDIQLSDSNLSSEIRKQRPIPDKEYLKWMYSDAETMHREFFEEFGGNENTIPDEIKEGRDNFQTILFLDEFYRKTSSRIRNMLRTILNGRIGVDKIPDGTYIVYASNLNDEGLDNVPKNADFAIIDMAAPTLFEWTRYLESKHGIEDDTEDLTEPEVEKARKKVKPNKEKSDD